MSKQYNILAVDDDQFFQITLAGIFSEYNCKVAESAETAAQILANFKADLILLDIELPGINGYDFCSQLKEQESTKDIPIIFLSQYSGLDDRLKAYGVGGSDYLSKPIEKDEVLAKVERVLSEKADKQELSAQLQDAYNTVLDMQLENADIQIIGRFLQANLFCRDFESLLHLFFKTVHELDIHCVIQIRTENEIIRRADNGEIPRLEKEILEMSGTLDRIFSFGRDRAIFNWENVSLLVRNLGRRIDLLAILMNSLESSINAINAEQKLLEMVLSLEDQNSLLKNEISELIVNMSISLKETFLSLGFVSNLDSAEEDMLNEKVDIFQELINDKLEKLNDNNSKIIELVNDLRTPSEEDFKKDEHVVDSYEFL